MLKGCVQNLKREFADLVVGMAVFTGQISQLVLQYRQWCLIGNLSPNSLFAARKFITVLHGPEGHQRVMKIVEGVDYPVLCYQSDGLGVTRSG